MAMKGNIHTGIIKNRQRNIKCDNFALGFFCLVISISCACVCAYLTSVNHTLIVTKLFEIARGYIFYLKNVSTMWRELQIPRLKFR